MENLALGKCVRIGLLSDARRHNLAIMRLSTYFRQRGDQVILNEPLRRCDETWGSWLWQRRYPADHNGGPAFDAAQRLPPEVESCRPDYSLYPAVDYSLGYTWEYCPRQCGFCVVPKQHPPKVHRSIWTFHESRFRKICLLNNNTFMDPQWRQTFEEIWDAGLTVVDQNGYDLRLLTEEKAEALAKTRFATPIHFAWDNPADDLRQQLAMARSTLGRRHLWVYVLIGYDSTREQDLWRCEEINAAGLDPYVMPYAAPGKRSRKEDRRFKRFIDLRFYRRYPTIAAAWKDYR